MVNNYVENSHTASYGLTTAESGTLHTNRGASGTISLALPANADMGIYYRFSVSDFQQLRVGAAWGETILLNGLDSASAYIWADAIGETISLICNGFGEWYVIQRYGLWEQVELTSSSTSSKSSSSSSVTSSSSSSSKSSSSSRSSSSSSSKSSSSSSSKSSSSSLSSSSSSTSSSSSASPEVLTRYVDTDTGDDTGGDGLSWDTAWRSMNKAESEMDDLGQNSDGNYTTTGGTYPAGIIGRLYLRGANDDTTIVTWNGFITDATHYIDIIGDGIYRLNVPDTTLLQVNESFIRFEGIEVSVHSTTQETLNCVVVNSISAGASDIRFTNCVIRGAGNNAEAMRGFFINDADAIVTLNNCLIYDMGQDTGSTGIIVFNSGGTCYAYNCVVDNSYRGMRADNHASAFIYGKNSIVSNTNIGYDIGAAGTIELTNCSGDDGTVDTFDTGSTCFDNVTPAWDSSPSTLYCILNEAPWTNGGLDLSSDNNWFVSPPTDIYGVSRPQGGDWDIGICEFDN